MTHPTYFKYDFANGRYRVHCVSDAGSIIVIEPREAATANAIANALNVALVPFYARPIGELLGDPGYLPRNARQADKTT